MASMHRGTMVEMTRREIEAAAAAGARVVVPLGVIEEHGPQLCAGTDILAACELSRRVADRLRAAGVPAVIAPPFYWGICQSTAGFAGSFGVRFETAKALLADILSSLGGFGFRRAYGINAHGDIDQHRVILAAFGEAARAGTIAARYAFAADRLVHYGLTGAEPFVCPFDFPGPFPGSARAPDIHAGDLETAIMRLLDPAYVREEIAAALPPVAIPDDRVMDWLLGGRARELSPEGYAGSPADYAGADAEGFLRAVSGAVAAGILRAEARA